MRLLPPARFRFPSPPCARPPALTRSSVASSETSARAQGRGSLRYADVPEDVRAMAAELESLGGAPDVAVGSASVYCAVCPAPLRAAALRATRRESDALSSRPRTIVSLLPDDADAPGVSVQDPHAPRRYYVPRAPREYRFAGVSSTGVSPDGLARDAAEWISRGFDALVLALRQSGTGKTRMLFSDGGGAHERDRPGVVSKIIRGVLARAAAPSAKVDAPPTTPRTVAPTSTPPTRGAPSATDSRSPRGRCARTATSSISSTPPARDGGSW